MAVDYWGFLEFCFCSIYNYMVAKMATKVAAVDWWNNFICGAIIPELSLVNNILVSRNNPHLCCFVCLFGFFKSQSKILQFCRDKLNQY